MRVTKAQAEANRERIVGEAARLLRERGPEGVGVAELMNRAGLTHGGFYGHFDSKEALVAEACERAFAESADRVARRLGDGGAEALRAYVAGYLSQRHCADRTQGCAAAALAGDVAREGAAPVRAAFTRGLTRLADALSEKLTGRARRRRALALLATLAGTLSLARAVDDPALSEEILAAAREELLARL